MLPALTSSQLSLHYFTSEPDYVANFFGNHTQVHVVPREKGEGDGRKLSMRATPLKSHCSRLQYFLNDCSVSLVPDTRTFAHLIGDLINEQQPKCQGHFRSLEGLMNCCGFRLCGFGIFGGQRRWNIIQNWLSFFEYNAHTRESWILQPRSLHRPGD